VTDLVRIFGNSFLFFIVSIAAFIPYWRIVDGDISASKPPIE